MNFDSGTTEQATHTQDLIVGMRRAGCTYAYIAGELNIPKSTVGNIIRRFLERGTTDSLVRSGRPKLISERGMRVILRMIYNNRRISLTKISSQITPRLSVSTIRRALHDIGLNSRIARVKPFLTTNHQAKRLAWAQERKDWVSEQRDRVIFTDELSVEWGENSRQIRVWRNPGDEWDTTCIVPSFKSGRTSVMVWGCMIAGKLGPLTVMPKGRRTGIDYRDLVMDGPLWDFYMQMMEERGEVVIMEDGAPIHRSAAASKWRATNEISILPWPAQSPDLNPIENIWKILKVRINELPVLPRNEDELVMALQEEWRNISNVIISNTVANMPQRLKDVISAKGGSTKY